MRPASDGSAREQPRRSPRARKTCERVRMSTPGDGAAEQPPPQRASRRRRSPRSVCSEPVWTMRKTPSSRAARRRRRSRRGSKPIGIAGRRRSASSGIAAATRAAASGAAMTTADALAARGACAAGRARGAAPVGCTRISSSAHGSSRSATHGTPSSRGERARRRGRSRTGAQDASTTSASRPTCVPSRTRLLDPPAHPAAARPSAREPRGRPVRLAGSAPATRWTSASAGIALEQLRVVRLPAVPRGCAGPVTTHRLVAVLRADGAPSRGCGARRRRPSAGNSARGTGLGAWRDRRLDVAWHDLNDGLGGSGGEQST